MSGLFWLINSKLCLLNLKRLSLKMRSILVEFRFAIDFRDRLVKIKKLVGFNGDQPLKKSALFADVEAIGQILGKVW